MPYQFCWFPYLQLLLARNPQHTMQTFNGIGHIQWHGSGVIAPQTTLVTQTDKRNEQEAFSYFLCSV
jgi:hypothetical protein